jgi:hypothetical protein
MGQLHWRSLPAIVSKYVYLDAPKIALASMLQVSIKEKKLLRDYI